MTIWQGIKIIFNKSSECILLIDIIFIRLKPCEIIIFVLLFFYHYLNKNCLRSLGIVLLQLDWMMFFV